MWLTCSNQQVGPTIEELSPQIIHGFKDKSKDSGVMIFVFIIRSLQGLATYLVRKRPVFRKPSTGVRGTVAVLSFAPGRLGTSIPDKSNMALSKT